ncbi:hypothetical protein BG36_05815 [Aquamicrobium defluvii]|uniref:Uncharacterized protein DUF4167 n=2 Tax=Aquamicrobium defluvii TaxID=69279 RepID=A0A011UKZ7_9HYPH|nr:hypothetical protein BG36_05815 [Aquamicrobium defluvii]EZQ14396.1 hypothetical protein CF98_19350 [Halopseudomonas bauzanensis]TDR36803.1 uncharacterized protein DUF4167 [Aquamicrobium defluvii]
MRPQQQNRRMRGRNNNGGNNNNSNRKGPNPLSRNYESNGPDVKIRGSAQQIAEKYAALARDAMSSGDRVIAENYLQHAEHYNRIIAAAQAQMPIQNVQPARDDFDDEVDEDQEAEAAAPVNGGESHAPAAVNGSGPQPVIEGVPAEVALNTETETSGENRASREGGRNRERAGGRGERRPRDARQKDKDIVAETVQAEAPAAPVLAEEPVSAPAEPAKDLGPAALAAAAEVKEAEAEAPAKPRRPRKPRVTAAAKDAAAAEAASTEVPASEG